MTMNWWRGSVETVIKNAAHGGKRLVCMQSGHANEWVCNRELNDMKPTFIKLKSTVQYVTGMPRNATIQVNILSHPVSDSLCIVFL